MLATERDGVLARLRAARVIQAPMAGVQDERLALAVDAAGGIGSVPCALLSADEVARWLGRVPVLAARVTLNFFCHGLPAPDAAREARWREALLPYYREFGIEPGAATGAVRRPIDAAVVAALEPHAPRVISFHFGLPSDGLLARIKAWGATVLASATTVEEGRWLEARGVDAVIAQGLEAGSHRAIFFRATSRRRPTRRPSSAASCTRCAFP